MKMIFRYSSLDDRRAKLNEKMKKLQSVSV